MNIELKQKLLSSQENESNELVEVSKLNRYFKKQGTYFKAVDNASFTINKKDFFGIIGESGSGKSTTGKMLIRLYPTSGGTVIFDKHLISQERISKKTRMWLCQNMQMIFQDPMSSLNPKKNVLTLVSEPFKINHKLDNIAKNIILDHIKINKYFQYTYMLEDSKISHKFFNKYYNGLVNVYKNGTKLLGEFEINYENDGIEELTKTLDIIADVEENAKKINFLVYDYTKDIKNIFTNCLDKFNKNEINENEINLFHSENKYKKYKQESIHCSEYLKLEEQLKQKETELKTINTNLKEWYIKENRMFIDSLIASYRLDLNAIKQSKSITRTNFEYFYQDVKQWKLEFFINCLTKLKECYWIPLTTFQQYVKEIENEIELITSPVLKIVIRLQAINNERLILVDNAIETYSNYSYELSKLRDITNVNGMFKCSFELKPFSIDRSESNKNFENSINELEKINDTILKIKKYVNEINKTYTIFNNIFTKEIEINKFENLNKIINIVIELNETEKNEKQDIVEATKTEISNIKSKMEELEKFESDSWTTTDEYKIAKEKLNKATIDLKNKKQACVDYTKQAIIEFNQEHGEMLNQNKIDIKNWKQNFKAEFKNYINKIKSIKSLLLKCKPNEILNNQIENWYKKFIKINEFKKDVKREINTRIKNLSSLNFEFQTNFGEVELYRNLRSTNKLILWVNFYSLVKILTRSKVYQALNEVGLKNEHAYRYPHEFSGGQRQRIVIARALINNPKLIIADEPISALDVSIQAQVVNIMKRLAEQKGITFIFIAHDLSMVNYACNRMIILHNGVIVEKGDTNEIFSNPIHPYTISLIKAAPELSKIHVDLAAFSELENYSSEYSLLNKPSFHEVSKEKEHFVFGTEDQIKNWIILAKKAKREKRKNK